ncbi:MAG: nucleotidyl transferase AbiEii/AbiGii toxin family protein [Candidatus Daviesbacteria bacterium]|nr:nucleotidyl transferase AbiEii/AbiGii toxin family protein [Candidatus Daviesbacteria bacterium]
MKQISDQTCPKGYPAVYCGVVYYPYPLIKKINIFSKIQIASLEDISAMKIAAICERGTKRDFIDLYFLAKEFSFEQMLKFFDQKYGVLKDQLYIILRSMEYFEDAEMDKMPNMLVPVSWEEVKKNFQDQVIKLAKRKLKI